MDAKQNSGSGEYQQRYRVTVSIDLWPVCRMMSATPTPFFAACVTRPARREWPAYFAGSSLAALAAAFTTRATLCAVSCAPTFPPLPICRNTGRAEIVLQRRHRTSGGMLTPDNALPG